MNDQQEFEFEPRKTIKGYPELHWTGKRPFKSTVYYPAQLKESYGSMQDGWINKIFWGDNLQVMSHLLKDYRGKVDLIYIDPPFDSKADYKKRIELKGKTVQNDTTIFEEKQYGDIWTNDEYLQFMYERLILLKELLSKKGSIYVHCDWHKSAFLRCIADEIFGRDNFINEIVWKRRSGILAQSKQYGVSTDSILFYSKSKDYQFFPILQKEGAEDYVAERFKYTDEKGRRYRISPMVSPSYSPNLIYEYKGFKPPKNGWSCSLETMKKWDEDGKLVLPMNKELRIQRKQYLDEWCGRPVQSLWDDIPPINPQAIERLDYPTQKPEKLIERIITASSSVGDLVFDCFMGSGTTQAVAMKLGRRFLGADINLGAIEITTKRLIKIAEELKTKEDKDSLFKESNNSISDNSRNSMPLPLHKF